MRDISSEWEKGWVKRRIPQTEVDPSPTGEMTDADGSKLWQPIEIKEDDFVMLDNRIKSGWENSRYVVAHGKYIKFMPNSIMLDTGFEVKAGDALAQYFTYIAFDNATKDSKTKGNVSADVSGKIEVIDHRKNKTYSVNCILFNVVSNRFNIYFDTLEGYTLIFRNVDDLRKVCDEEG